MKTPLDLHKLEGTLWNENGEVLVFCQTSAYQFQLITLAGNRWNSDVYKTAIQFENYVKKHKLKKISLTLKDVFDKNFTKSAQVLFG